MSIENIISNKLVFKTTKLKCKNCGKQIEEKTSLSVFSQNPITKKTCPDCGGKLVEIISEGTCGRLY